MRNFVHFSVDSEEYGFLSNWYESDMVVDGIRFKCMWQYLLYQKAVLYGDYEIARLVRRARSIQDVKDVKRKVGWLENKLWVDRRYSIAKRGIIAKFSCSDILMCRLLEFPCDTVFVECNPFDREWSCGLYIGDKDIHNEEKWRGLNLLGKILTEVRMELEGVYVE